MTDRSLDVSRRRILQIAWPIILSNLSTPLLGLVDTAVIGNLNDASLIGAIAIGAMIFSFLYWGFGFLRMGTTGLVAQAVGRGDRDEASATFYRALGIGAGVGVLLFFLQVPLALLAFHLIDASRDVESAAATYFHIRILGAPVSLAHLAVIGYLLGTQRTRALLAVQLTLNGINIILDFVFVVGLDWNVAGVAAATVIAEVCALLLGGSLVLSELKRERGTLLIARERLMDIAALVMMFRVNRDIMIRTLCLIFAFAWFTNEGAKYGDTILAGNAILMQFVSFSAFFLDGFALSAETLVGTAIGARNPGALSTSMRRSTELAFVTAMLMSAGIALAGSSVIALLTNVEAVRASAATYLPWAVAAPVVSVWCYLLDGIFIGATRTAEMRNAMIASLLAFLGAWWWLADAFGNHGLWLALLFYFIARAASLAWYLPSVRAAVVTTR